MWPSSWVLLSLWSLYRLRLDFIQLLLSVSIILWRALNQPKVKDIFEDAIHFHIVIWLQSSNSFPSLFCCAVGTRWLNPNLFFISNGFKQVSLLGNWFGFWMPPLVINDHSLWHSFLRLPRLERHTVPKHCFGRWYTSSISNSFYGPVVSFHNLISTGSVSCLVVSPDIPSVQCLLKDLWVKRSAIVHQHLFNWSVLQKNLIQQSCNDVYCFCLDMPLNGKLPRATVNLRQIRSTPIMHYIDGQSDPIGVHLNLFQFMNAWWGVNQLAMVTASNHPLNYLSYHIWFDFPHQVQHSFHSNVMQIVQLFHLLLPNTAHSSGIFLHLQPMLSHPCQRIGLTPIRGHKHYTQLSLKLICHFPQNAQMLQDNQFCCSFHPDTFLICDHRMYPTGNSNWISSDLNLYLCAF